LELNIKVEIHRVIYRGSNNWCVLSVKPLDRIRELGSPFIVTGDFLPQDLIADSNISLVGRISTHPKYGKQLIVSSYKVLEENKTNREYIINFLTQSYIEGIGINTAKKIHAMFGDNSIQTVLTNPNALLALSGIGEKTLNKIKLSGETYLSMKEAIDLGTSLGLKHSLIVKLHKVLGNDFCNTLNKDPYALLTYPELVTFSIVDTIAIASGVDRLDAKRVQFAILETLNSICVFGGSTGVSVDVLEAKAVKLLVAQDSMAFLRALKALERSESVIRKGKIIYLTKFYLAEQNIASKLIELRDAPHTYNFNNNVIQEAVSNFPYNLNSSQKDAIQNCLKNNVNVITGLAGTGKSSIQKALVDIYSKHDFNLVLLCPTGKGARRLEECVHQPASTVHRFLKFKGNLDEVETVYLPKKSVVFIDESSMVDITLLDKLLKCCVEGNVIIFIGDYRQLPSVSAGNVLKDLVESEDIPTQYLTDIARQQETSNIIKFCSDINDGKIFDEQNKQDFIYLRFANQEQLLESLKRLYAAELKLLGDISDVQILTLYKKGVIGCSNINKVSSKEVNSNYMDEKFKLKLGDKVIQIKNDYSKGVFNGESGIVSNIDDSDLTVNFSGVEILYSNLERDDLDLAYALTVHKSQGSEYSTVFVVVDDNLNLLLTRQLLYTAVSRAKKKVYILSMNNGTETCILNQNSKPRISLLKEFLRGQSV